MYKIEFLALGTALAASAWSIRTAFSDYQIRRNTVDGMEKAIALEPDNGESYRRLAWLSFDPKESKNTLSRAVSLNPRDAASWIELGLKAEAEGDGGTAEACLLRAWEVDRTFLPRWTLANYYFRRHDEAKFWLWMKRAAAMVSGDPEPLFRLCGKVEENGRLIDRLEMGNGDLRARYLGYLLAENQIGLIAPAMHRLLTDNRETDVPLLLTACERLLDAGQGALAADVWNGLAKSGRVAMSSGENEQAVVNASFALPPSSRGLDWRLPSTEGVSVAREADLRGLRVTFSGRQPEECDGLVQMIPLKHEVHYELKFTYRTKGVASGTGLRWRVTDARGGTTVAESASLASESDTEGQLRFYAPLNGLARLALTYSRAPGTTRMEGFITLRNVAIRPLRPMAQLLTEGGRVRR